jgi:DNA polymerase I-like protein with 3'-5' exonuclease and polymerase domains
MKSCYIDFEYKDAQEKKMNLVCACLKVKDKTSRLWLYKEEEMQKRLAKSLTLHKDDWVFVSYNVLAEARSFISIGLNPLDFKWIDLMAMFRWYKNGNQHQQALNSSLAQAMQTICGIDIDIISKEQNVKMILDTDIFDMVQRTQILNYCEDDIKDLHTLTNKLISEISMIYKMSAVDVVKVAADHSRYVAAMARVETEGIPLNMDWVKTLSLNHDMVKKTLIDKCNKVYPFYLDGVLKYDVFNQYIFDKGLESIWPQTASGQFSRDNDVLGKYSYLPEINILEKTTELIKQVGWFRPSALPNFLSKVGSDSRLRPFYNCFGTISGRNTPPAKTFILAMSSWLRSLIHPPEGFVITESDYSSQEFMVAAVLSEDAAMQEAYSSGDPYFNFAVSAGLIPEDGKLEDYKPEREHCKSLCLGVQFGMGVSSLAKSLAGDDEEPEDDKARELLRQHKRVFWKYWRWIDSLNERIAACENFTLWDGWSCQTNTERLLTFRNFWVQGTAACITRHATVLALEAGLKVVANLHDSIYIIHAEDDQESSKKLEEVMLQSVHDVLGDYDIRTSTKSHTHEEVWIDKKGADNYNLLKEYLSSPAGDVLQEINLFTGEVIDKGLIIKEE